MPYSNIKTGSNLSCFSFQTMAHNAKQVGGFIIYLELRLECQTSLLLLLLLSLFSLSSLFLLWNVIVIHFSNYWPTCYQIRCFFSFYQTIFCQTARTKFCPKPILFPGKYKYTWNNFPQWVHTFTYGGLLNTVKKLISWGSHYSL
jgi:hypothetical protein